MEMMMTYVVYIIQFKCIFISNVWNVWTISNPFSELEKSDKTNWYVCLGVGVLVREGNLIEFLFTHLHHNFFRLAKKLVTKETKKKFSIEALESVSVAVDV